MLTIEVFPRKLLNLLLSILFTLVLVACTDESVYPDVSEEYVHYEAIIALTEAGIVEAYDEEGQFGQSEAITRQDSAQMIYRAFDLEEPEDIDGSLAVFNDIDSSHPYAKEIAAVTEAGTYEEWDSSFSPDESLSVQQAVSLVLRVSDLDEFEADEKQEMDLHSVDSPYEQHVQIAADLGLLNGWDDFQPKEVVSRGEFASLIYQLMQKIEELGNEYKLFDKKIVKDIDVENMYETIEFLSEEPRIAGTESEYRAVGFISDEFERFGYDVEIQSFPISMYLPKTRVIIDDEFEIEEARAFSWSADRIVTAELADVGKALPEEIGDVDGKIVLIEGGEIPFNEKIKNVFDQGAHGVMIYSEDDENIYGQLGYEHRLYPVAEIPREAGLELVKHLKEQEEVIAELDVKYEEHSLASHNVIATRKPDPENDTGQVIIIGAHHDSVPDSPGANDNASGVSAVLELARVFADYPVDTEVRFVTFGAEEWGLFGSAYYVENLPEAEQERVVAYFNMDMIGSEDAGAEYPLGGLIMYTVDGEKNTVTDFGAASAVKMIGEMLPYGEEGRSDHWSFHEAGIPAATFIHSPLEPWYHQPEDTIDRIDKEKLEEVARIIGAATYQIARPETPELTTREEGRELVEYPFEERSVD